MSRSLVCEIADHVEVDGVVEYVINVGFVGKEETWQVRQRYRRFLDLHRRLRSFYGDATPTFPERRFFGMGKFFLGPQSEDFVLERAASLQQYLEGVLALEPGSAPPALQQFLGLEVPEGEASPTGSRPMHWMVKKGGRGRFSTIGRPLPLEYSTVEVYEVAAAVAAAAGAVAARKLRAASPAAAEGLRRLLPTLLADRKSLLVCGGSSTSAQDFVQRFCPERGVWDELPEMRLARRSCTAASVEGRCYVVGGVDQLIASAAKPGVTAEHVADNWSEYFDPVSGGWELLAPSGPAYTHAAAVASGGFIYVFGGLCSTGAMSNAQRLEPGRRSWLALRPMPTPRFECAAAGLLGQLYVVGGSSSSGEPLAVVECFDPSVGKWTPGTPCMNLPRFGCAAAAAGGRIFVLGGHCHGESLAGVEALDPQKGRWEALAPMPLARHRCGAAAVAGRVYVFGGNDGQRDLDSAACFDVSAGTWQALPPMPRPCGRCCAAAAAS